MSKRIAALGARLTICVILMTLTWSRSSRDRLARWIADVLWVVVPKRRRIALRNLELCFPEKTLEERTQLARKTFHNVVACLFDHAILWKGSKEDIQAMVKFEGPSTSLVTNGSDRPVILLAPHFVGLDAAGSRISMEGKAISIYARQSNPVWDEWFNRGRARFNEPILIARDSTDLRAIIRLMKEGLPFYYLPDMDNGPTNSIFVPFFGVPAATLSMVPRLAKITGALVVLAVCERHEKGYTVHLEAPWEDFPSGSVEQDTCRMNEVIEQWVRRFPDQYLWAHRRFKTRPPGEASVY